MTSIGVSREIEDRFRSVISHLDDVTQRYRIARQSIVELGRYEADLAAIKLMQATWLHINALSSVAEIPYTGSHSISAWVLLRAAFEAGLTAWWLVAPENWIEREARWLQWIKREEIHRDKLSKSSNVFGADFVTQLEGERDRLAKRRQDISNLLLDNVAPDQRPKVERQLRPPTVSMEQIIRETGLPSRYYIVYRVSSHYTHSGPSTSNTLLQFANDENTQTSIPCDWSEMFCAASWLMTDPGQVVLIRCGANHEDVARIVDAHNNLLDCVAELKRLCAQHV